MEFCESSEMRANDALHLYTWNHKFGSRYIPAHFTNPNNLTIATIGQEKDWDPSNFFGWATVSPIVSSHKGYLIFSIALSL